MPGKTEYPPPAHSRIPTTKSSEKPSSHHSLPKAEVNVYGFAAYQPSTFFVHEPKNKADHHHKSPSQPSGLVVTKSSSAVDRDVLPNPPPLISELNKNSVIVKHDGKNPHHLDSRVSIAHSQSPKLRPDMMQHYMPGTGQQHKTSMYEYRSPTQSPLHVPHAPSPHHLEPQNLGKTTHHRSGQLPSPHHQRNSPHPHSQSHSNEMRYRSSSESQAMIYPSTVKGTMSSNYPYLTSTTVQHYTVAANTLSNSKPKVSSPAPHHIYGKPSAGLGSSISVTRVHDPPSNPLPLTSKPPLSAPVSSPYQQVSPYHPPHPQTTQIHCLPPPAHSSRPTSTPSMESRNVIYGMYPGSSVPGALSAKQSIQHGTSPPTAASAPSPVSRTYPQYTIPGITHNSQSITGVQSVQTQPLDLGISSSKYDPATSPKRKLSTSGMSGPVCLEVKKRKTEGPENASSQNLSAHGINNSQPQLARVSEPSPLIVSAATTITTVVNTAAYRSPTSSNSAVTSQSPVLTDVLSDVSVTAVALVNDKPPSSENSPIQTSNSSNSLLNNSVQQNTNATASSETITIPVKSVTPTNVDSEKSNSPGPMKSGSYPVRHLKKAWLQRHTGEDLEDTTGVIGSGSCVTLPLNINSSNQPPKENSVSSLHNIGSMAVNSINKTKHFTANKSNNRKSGHKDNSTALNGHQVDAAKDDSSSSDQERGRKSPPKRKPPKMKRKKGGGVSAKKTEEQKKRKVSGQSAAAPSDSGSDSDKESGSEKDSDSGASTTPATSKKANNNAGKEKEPRKRGRRPKTSKNDKGEEPRPKKSKDDSVPQRDPFRKPPVGQLKKTGESFLQDGPCFEVAPKLAKCRECRWTPNQRSKNMPNIFCRFFAFRRLRYTKNGQLAIAGFSDPHKDALEVILYY